VWNYLYQNVDVTGQVVTINCTGNFAAGLFAQTIVVGATPQSIVFSFASGATVAAPNSSAFVAFNGGVAFTVTGNVTITATGSGVNQGYGLLAANGGEIWYSGVNFGACVASHQLAGGFGLLQCTGSYTISGGAVNHLNSAGGMVNLQTPTGSTPTITLSGTPAFSGAFANAANSGAMITAGGVSFVGSATGSRYAATVNASINTLAGGATYFPGSSAGSTASGGQYA
jgi:hypothetical protein